MRSPQGGGELVGVGACGEEQERLGEAFADVVGSGAVRFGERGDLLVEGVGVGDGPDELAEPVGDDGVQACGGVLGLGGFDDPAGRGLQDTGVGGGDRVQGAVGEAVDDRQDPVDADAGDRRGPQRGLRRR